jgi:hypothetical protein
MFRSQNDEYDKVRCRICNRGFKAITPSHLQKDHNITIVEYTQQFPEAPLFNKARGIIHSKRMKKIWADPDYKKRASSTMTKVWEDPKYKKKTSQALKLAAQDPQFREKIADLSAKRWEDPKYKKRVSKAISNAASTHEARERESTKFKELWEDPEYRASQTEKVRKNQKSLKRIKAAKRAIKRKWEMDPAYRKKMTRTAKLQWTPEKREAKSQEMKRKWKNPEYREKMSEQSQKMWEDPEHQERMKPIVARWTKPEKIVRGWLQKLGLYKTGHDGGVGFLPHRWLPTRGAGFSANGDFVDYNHKLILHVDGDYWHSLPDVIEQDRRLDAWCDTKGWRYLRLTESEIYKQSAHFQQTIRIFALTS